MTISGKTRFIRLVKGNALINQYIPPQYMSRFLHDLEFELSRYSEQCWEDKEQIRNIVNKGMPVALCRYHFPRMQISKVIEQCLRAYHDGTETNNAGKISKVTGKVMSDSLDKSFEKMAKQLPDILIPDFVRYMGKLEAHPAAAEKYEPDWQHSRVWYQSQKEHVRGWMNAQMTHGGDTSYHRDNLNISSRTSYNHWNNPGMALWLASALGEDDELVIAAAEEAYKEPNVRRRSGIIRKHFPFDRIIELLSKDPDGEKIIIRTEEKLNQAINEV